VSQRAASAPATSAGKKSAWWLSPAHAIAHLLRDGARWADSGPVVVCLSGRGDKDVAQVAELTGGRA